MVPVVATLRLRGIPFIGYLDDLLYAVFHSKAVQVDFKFQDVLADSRTSPGIARAGFGYPSGQEILLTSEKLQVWVVLHT